MSYAEDLPPVLRGLSIKIAAGEKVNNQTAVSYLNVDVIHQTYSQLVQSFIDRDMRPDGRWEELDRRGSVQPCRLSHWLH